MKRIDSPSLLGAQYAYFEERGYFAPSKGGGVNPHKEKRQMKNTTVGFLTYNSIGKAGNISNGAHETPERRAIVLQGSPKDIWAASKVYGGGKVPPPGYDRDQGQYVNFISNEIDRLWADLSQGIDEFDHIIIYVGAKGSERALELAASLPPQKVTLVMCDCELGRKLHLISQIGNLKEARRILCECGGNMTFYRMFWHYLETGIVIPEEVVQLLAI